MVGDDLFGHLLAHLGNGEACHHFARGVAAGTLGGAREVEGFFAVLRAATVVGEVDFQPLGRRVLPRWSRVALMYL